MLPDLVAVLGQGVVGNLRVPPLCSPTTWTVWTPQPTRRPVPRLRRRWPVRRRPRGTPAGAAGPGDPSLGPELRRRVRAVPLPCGRAGGAGDPVAGSGAGGPARRGAGWASLGSTGRLQRPVLRQGGPRRRGDLGVGQAWGMSEATWHAADIDHVILTEEQIRARPTNSRNASPQTSLVPIPCYSSASSRALCCSWPIFLGRSRLRATGRVGVHGRVVVRPGHDVSSGVVRILKDLDRDIAGRHVIVVEDIIDSGLDPLLVAALPAEPKGRVCRGSSHDAQTRCREGECPGQVRGVPTFRTSLWWDTGLLR